MTATYPRQPLIGSMTLGARPGISSSRRRRLTEECEAAFAKLRSGTSDDAPPLPEAARMTGRDEPGRAARREERRRAVRRRRSDRCRPASPVRLSAIPVVAGGARRRRRARREDGALGEAKDRPTTASRRVAASARRADPIATDTRHAPRLEAPVGPGATEARRRDQREHLAEVGRLLRSRLRHRPEHDVPALGDRLRRARR